MTGASGTAGLFRGSKLHIACASAVFIAALVLYTWTLAPTVTLVDSGELIVAARSLGVAHPPGFPLYVLLAHLATMVPIGSVAVRVNFASALFAAMAASVATLVAFEAMTTVRLLVGNTARRKAARSSKGKKTASSPQSPGDTATQSSYLLAASCLVSGLLLAFSRTLWAYATIAEVYTLNSLLILVVFLLMFRWRRVNETGRRGDGETGRRGDGATHRGTLADVSSPSRPVAQSPRHSFLYAAAFVFGLAMGVHHVTVGLLLPAFAAFVLATEGVRFFTSRRLIYAALFAFAGLSIYAYLPLAASKSPIMNWGDPRTLERLWWHVTGRQYQVFFSFSLGTIATQLGEFIKLAAREFGPWWLPAAPALAIAGLVVTSRRDKPTFWFLTLVIAADLVYSLNYEIAEDKDAYYLPAVIAAVIAAGFGAQWCISEAITRRIFGNGSRVIAGIVVLLVLVAAIVANLPYNNRSRYFIAQDYVDNVFSTIEPGGMLLTRDWQVYSPMLYTREIEHRRDDVVSIDVNQLRRSWYFDYLERVYPSTIANARDKVDAFLEDLRHWERDPDLYSRDVTLNQRINTRFFEMILAFVTGHIGSSPVYVTIDIAANREGPDSELTKSLLASYQLIPHGLIFQVSPLRDFQQPSEPQLIMRGLSDGTIKFEDDDVVKLKVLPVYVTMIYNRGRYLAAHGRHEQAIESYKQALALQPGFAAAQQAINESLSAGLKTNPKKFQ